jgi:hypothetical protein
MQHWHFPGVRRQPTHRSIRAPAASVLTARRASFHWLAARRDLDSRSLHDGKQGSVPIQRAKPPPLQFTRSPSCPTTPFPLSPCIITVCVVCYLICWLCVHRLLHSLSSTARYERSTESLHTQPAHACLMLSYGLNINSSWAETHLQAAFTHNQVERGRLKMALRQSGLLVEHD